MFFTQTGPTPWDVRFSLFGFPVRISPVFWFVALILGGNMPPEAALMWVVAVLVSILVHELGHAFVQRAFGGRPEIVLYAFGGLAHAPGVRETPLRSMLISLAGPLAGFALFGLVFAADRSEIFIANRQLILLSSFLLWINLVWSLLNLAPIWPLDGGRIAREVLVLLLRPSLGVSVSLALSGVCATACAVWMFSSTGSLWNTMLFGVLAFESFKTLRRYRESLG